VVGVDVNWLIAVAPLELPICVSSENCGTDIYLDLLDRTLAFDGS
jgi:hypothetical protein